MPLWIFKFCWDLWGLHHPQRVLCLVKDFRSRPGLALGPGIFVFYPALGRAFAQAKFLNSPASRFFYPAPTGRGPGGGGVLLGPTPPYNSLVSNKNFQ